MTNPTRTTTPTTQARPNTFTALSSPNYLIFWIGALVSVTGVQMQMVAQGWLVYRLTNSPLYLGVVGLFNAVPTIVLSLFGGVVADRVNRLRLLMVTQSCTALIMIVLATLTATGAIQVWHILLLTFLSGSVWAFDQPTRQALVPQLVERHQLPSAIALISTVWQLSRIVGPSIAGVLVAVAGEAACFYINAAGAIVMAGALSRIRLAKDSGPGGGGSVWRNLIDGLRFIASNPLFFTLIGMTFFNSVFGMAYATVMPVFANDVLAVGATGLGFLMGASGVGALVGTLLVAPLGSFGRRGWVLLGGSFAFSSLITVFAFSKLFELSLGAMVIVGLANALYMTTVNTALQTEVPDALRGRVMGVYGMTWSLMPLGGLLAGAVAQVLGAPTAVGLGGIVVMSSTVLIAMFVPLMRRLA